jgi:hypothetical protein
MHFKLFTGLITIFVLSLNSNVLAQDISVTEPRIPSVPELQKVEELQQEFNKSHAHLNTCSNLIIPEPINLLQPFPESWLQCVPDLSSINSKFQGVNNMIKTGLDRLSGLEIGNEGKYTLDSITYSVSSNMVEVRGVIQAKHQIGEIKEQIPVPIMVDKTIKVPENYTAYRKEKVPVTKYRTIRECAIPWFNGCKKWVTTKVPYVVLEWRDIPYPAVRMVDKVVKVPDVEMQWRTFTPPPISATCNYSYSFNTLTSEDTPILSCGDGSLGNLTLNASSLSKALKGEIPSIGSILTSVKPVPPGLKITENDYYDNIQLAKTSGHKFTYFSSKSFVNEMSVSVQGVNVIADIASLGTLTSTHSESIRSLLVAEATRAATSFTAQGLAVSSQEIMNLIETGKISTETSLNFNVEMLNVPITRTTCLTGVSNECTPSFSEPRIGFVITVN